MTTLLKNICRDIPALGGEWKDFRYSLTTKDTKKFHEGAQRYFVGNHVLRAPLWFYIWLYRKIGFPLFWEQLHKVLLNRFQIPFFALI